MKVNLAFDIGGTSVKFGYGKAAETFDFFDRKEILQPTREKIFEFLKKTILELSKTKEIEKIVLGTPGIVDVTSGDIVANSPNIPDLVNSYPANFVRNLINVPVFLENDADLMTLGEATNYEYEKIVFGITLGTGIGAGLCLNRKIYRNKSHSAMELGHVIVDCNGTICGCGKKGCLETYFSVSAFQKRFVGEIDDDKISDFLKLSQSNSLVRDYVYKGYDFLAVAVSNVIQLIHPDVVVFGGGLCEITHFDFNYLKTRILGLLWDYHSQTVEITTARLGNRAGVWGGINHNI